MFYARSDSYTHTHTHMDVKVRPTYDNIVFVYVDAPETQHNLPKMRENPHNTTASFLSPVGFVVHHARNLDTKPK